jgi:hypothetical protein
MTNQTPRQPEQQQDAGHQRQPEQQQRQHHDPRGPAGAGAGLAGQTPKGGVSQDGFGQSGDQGAPDQTERNARPGG